MSSTDALHNSFRKFRYESHENVKTIDFRASAISARCINSR
jgi:hypothetical protein